MTRAYIVTGAERSLTRYMTRWLIASGCLGDGTHRQTFDEAVPLERKVMQPIVWRRGFPHAKRWPSLPDMVSALERRGFEPLVVWMIRDKRCCAPSVANIGMARDYPTASDNYDRALLMIADGILHARVPYVAVIAHLLYHPEEERRAAYRLLLSADLGITLFPDGPDERLYDPDTKWLEGDPDAEYPD